MLLKFFQVEGRFPNDRKEIPGAALDYLAAQLEVSREVFSQYELRGRSSERDRAQIRSLLGFRRVTVDDSHALAQSGEMDRHGRITKRCSRLLRSILLECAWASLRYNLWARTTYDRIHGGQRTRKKKAAIAVARKIAVVAWSMLKRETDWDPRRMGIDVEEQSGPKETATGSRTQDRRRRGRAA